MTDLKRPKQKAKPEVDPKLDAPIMDADKTHVSDEARLDTGMKVGEAINQAAIWWDTKGLAMIRDKNLATDNPGHKFFNPDPKTAEEAKNWLPSGILAGKPWDDLTRAEKLQVTKFWHHYHVRVPNIDPEMYQRAKKRPGVCFYCDELGVADEQLPNGEARGMCFAHFMDRYPAEAEEAFSKGPVN